MAPGNKKSKKRTSIGGCQASLPFPATNPNSNNDNIQSTPGDAATTSNDVTPQTRKRRQSAHEQARSNMHVLVEGPIDPFADGFLDAFEASTSGNKDKTSPSDVIVSDIVVVSTVPTDAPVVEEDVVMDDRNDESEDEDSSLFGEPEPMEVEASPNVALKVERGTTSKTASSSTTAPSRSAQPVSQHDLPHKRTASAQPVKAERKAPKTEKKAPSTATKAPPVKTTKKKHASTREDNMSTACESVAPVHGSRHAVPSNLQLSKCGSKVSKTPRTDKNVTAASGSTLQAGATPQVAPRPKQKLAYGEDTKTVDPRRRLAPTTVAPVVAPAPVVAEPVATTRDAAHARKTTRPAKLSTPAPAPVAAQSQSTPSSGPSSTLVPAPAVVTTSAQQVQPAWPVLGTVPVVKNLQPIDTGIERPKTQRPLTAKVMPDANIDARARSKSKEPTPAVVVAPSTSSAQAKENADRASSVSMTSVDRLMIAKEQGRAASVAAVAAVRPTPAPLNIPASPPRPPSPPSTGTTPVPQASSTTAPAPVASIPAAPVPTPSTSKVEDVPTRPWTVDAEAPAPLLAAPAPVTPQVPQKRFNSDAGSDVPSKRQRVDEPSSSRSGPATQQLITNKKHWHGDDQLVDIQCGMVMLNGWRDRLSQESDLFSTLLNIPATMALTGRPFVDITGHCRDVQGVELILDELDNEGTVLRSEGCTQADIRRLLRTSHALDFKKIFHRCVEALRKTWPASAWRIGLSTARLPMVDALDTIRCVRECDPQYNHLREVFLRAAYETFTACKASFKLRDVMAALGFVVGDSPEILADRLEDVNAVRNHCHGRWAKYRSGPGPEYPAVCPHATEPLQLSEAQRLDKPQRWLDTMLGIEEGFACSSTDWTFDPIRAGWALRSHRIIRPHGWQVCPEEKCKLAIYAAWNRRMKREWLDFVGVIRRYIWAEVVEAEEADG
ncbi:unnamed protein product [Peniophora sp. CBMAI 1063]|nr:unnamed protein product [Peniophora sp. CBMAI 1063]